MANAVYQQIGTPITFKSAAGTVLWTPTSVGFQAGRQSDEWDRGASPQPEEYSWRAEIVLQTGASPGETIDFYFATSDGTTVDGAVIPGDGPFTDGPALPNMLYVGSLIADSIIAVPIKGSGTFRMYAQYGTLVMWNNTVGETLSTTATDHEFIVTPIYPEVQ